MVSYEGMRLKLLKLRRVSVANVRKKRLNDTNFTIISNNCWGGMLYECYNLPKQSPTVGLFIMASDYIKFLSDLRNYINTPLEFIDPEKSKWKNKLAKDEQFGSYPIGRLKDVEIFFLHYASQEEAREKWNRRVKRINWDRILVKFNDQNGCTEKDVEDFLRLPFEHKIFFTCKDWNVEDDNNVIIKIRQHIKPDFVRASYEPFGHNRYIDLDKLVNSL